MSTRTPNTDRGRHRRRLRRPLIATAIAAALLALAATAFAGPTAFIGPFGTITTITSTVPENGDVNPYGIVTVPHSAGALVAGDILIANFNAASNLQGTGTTIDELSPSSAHMPPGSAHVFAKINASALPGPCPGGVGLTTALAALPSGFVVVGSLPTTDGTSATAKAGCLLVLGDQGQVVETIAGPMIDGPWDMTSVSHGEWTTLFVSNVLPGITDRTADHANIVRIRLETAPGKIPAVAGESVIATGFTARTDPTALVIGPTGLALGDHGTLYVADTLGNRIASVPNAIGRNTPFRHGGTTVTTGGFLNGPLGLALAPNGDILTANAGDGFIVETAPDGTQLAARIADMNPAGSAGTLFGLVVANGTDGVYYVDDGDNALRLLH